MRHALKVIDPEGVSERLRNRLRRMLKVLLYAFDTRRASKSSYSMESTSH